MEHNREIGHKNAPISYTCILNFRVKHLDNYMQVHKTLAHLVSSFPK